MVAPPPLESEGFEIEKLKGGCPPTPCSPSSFSCVVRLRPLAQERMADLKQAVVAGKVDRAGVIASLSEIVKESLEVIKIPLHGSKSITVQPDDKSA